MKLITALLACLLVFASACDRGPRTTRAASDSELARHDRDMYEDRVEARLNDFEHRIDGLEARRKGLDKATQDRLDQDIAELRDRKDALDQKVSDLHKVSDQSWLDVKASLDRDLEQLEQAYSVVAANNK
jgi:C4-dicarboxylate-specific signal transduction histidine kinase